MAERLCEYSALGVIDDGTLPNEPEFAGRCTCRAIVTIRDGRFPVHYPGIHDFTGGCDCTPCSQQRAAWASVNAALDQHGDGPEYRAAWDNWAALSNGPESPLAESRGSETPPTDVQRIAPKVATSPEPVNGLDTSVRGGGTP